MEGEYRKVRHSKADCGVAYEAVYGRGGEREQRFRKRGEAREWL